MNYLLSALIGYFIGSINPSHLLAKMQGFDIRERGSKNAGATNALLVLGKVSGILCAFFDIFKAYFAIFIARAIFPDFTQALAVTGVACFLGHIFPFYLKFRGGKGTACLGGLILCYNWRVFLIMLAAEVLLLLIVGYICLVPVTASLAFPIIYGIMTKDGIGTLLLLIIAVIAALKHRENFRRIGIGTEFRFSYLWNPQAEIARVKHNLIMKEGKSDEEIAELLREIRQQA